MKGVRAMQNKTKKETPEDQQKPNYDDLEEFIIDVKLKLRLVWRYFSDFHAQSRMDINRYNAVSVKIGSPQNQRVEVGILTDGMFIDEGDASAIEKCLEELWDRAEELCDTF